MTAAVAVREIHLKPDCILQHSDGGSHASLLPGQLWQRHLAIARLVPFRVACRNLFLWQRLEEDGVVHECIGFCNSGWKWPTVVVTTFLSRTSAPPGASGRGAARPYWRSRR